VCVCVCVCVYRAIVARMILGPVINETHGFPEKVVGVVPIF